MKSNWRNYFKHIHTPILSCLFLYRNKFFTVDNKLHSLEEKRNAKSLTNLEKDLNFHLASLEHHMDHLINKEQLVFNFVLKAKESQIGLNKLYNNYRVSKELKKLQIQTRKINKILKSYINELESLLDKNIFSHDLDVNHIVSEIKKISEIKSYMSGNNFYNENISDTINTTNETFLSYVFHENEAVTMRLLSLLVIFHKNSEENSIEEENLQFILNLCKDMLDVEKNNKNTINEASIYHAKRVLINLLTRKDYFYQDFIMEINQQVNFKEISEIKDLTQGREIIKDDEAFDYDVVFLSGLNANFSKSWRVPKEEPWKEVNYKHKLDYLLYGKNLDRIFAFPIYELWIPIMFESKTFAGKKFRYLVTCAETKIFTQDLLAGNIPDFTLDQISERIYHSFKRAGIGKRPVILICHSMGGLITKKVLNFAKEEIKEMNVSSSPSYDLLKNIRGVVFFSTPHYGSDVVTTLLDSGVNSLSKTLKQFETTSVEYGLQEEDIKNKFSDVPLTRATKEICLTPREVFEKEHEKFKGLKLDYICMIETEKTFIRGFYQYIHLVDPLSARLPEVENVILHGKKHGNLQKFSPDNFDEKGYKHLVKFIKDKMKV